MEVLRVIDLPNSFKMVPVHYSHDAGKDADWVASQKRLYHGRETDWDQQMEIAFSSVTGERVFTGFSETVNAAKRLKLDSKLPLLLACDFNIHPMAWVICQWNPPNLYAIDEIFLTPGTTEDAANEFVNRYSGVRNGVEIHGDPAGSSRQQIDGRSNYDVIEAILKPHFPWVTRMVLRSHARVKDSVVSVNMMMKNLDGIPHFFIDPQNCPQLLRDFAEVVWDPRGNIKKSTDPKDPYFLRTHASEGVRNLIHRKWPARVQMDEPKKKKSGFIKRAYKGILKV